MKGHFVCASDLFLSECPHNSFVCFTFCDILSFLFIISVSYTISCHLLSSCCPSLTSAFSNSTPSFLLLDFHPPQRPPSIFLTFPSLYPSFHILPCLPSSPLRGMSLQRSGPLGAALLSAPPVEDSAQMAGDGGPSCNPPPPSFRLHLPTPAPPPLGGRQVLPCGTVCTPRCLSVSLHAAQLATVEEREWRQRERK